MAISHCYWHLVVNNGNFTLLLNIVVENGNFTLLLTSSGQEWQFTLLLTSSGSEMAISHCYWHLVVKNGNFTLLLKDLVVKNGNFTLLLTSSGQEWQCDIFTFDICQILTSAPPIWNCQEWQFHQLEPIQNGCYWHLVVKNGNFTLLLTI